MGNVHHHSRFIDKGLSIAERVVRTIRKLIKRPTLLRGIVEWKIELSSITNQINNTIHHPAKMDLGQASLKRSEKTVSSNLQDRRET